jgi:predicted dehydrogenase
MQNSPTVNRRSFLKRSATATAAGAAAPYFVSTAALGAGQEAGANDKLNIGLIGAGGMGRGNLMNCTKDPNVVVAAVCDVWKDRRDAVVKQFPDAKSFGDYREMLQLPDLDGVIIATPPHWHCLIAVEACQMGKDIYLQKPMTLHVAESLAVREAVRRHKRVSQIGTQIHATENYRRVVELIQSGNLGDISVARTFNVMNQGPEGIGKPPESRPPEGLDWQFWMGPAPEYPYNPLIVRSAYENCSFMDYSGGWTPGMAPHIVDLPYWALNLGIPKTTYCSGGRFVIDDAGDAPDTQEVLWHYDDMTLTWTMNCANSFGFDFGRGKEARRLGIYFHGVNGTLYADYGTHTVVPEGDRMKGLEPPEKSIAPSPGHELEWLACMRSRKQPSCCVDYHYKIDLALVLANLSMKVGRAIDFDAETHRIVNDAEAAKLAVPEYRSPWKFPTDYLPG